MLHFARDHWLVIIGVLVTIYIIASTSGHIYIRNHRIFDSNKPTSSTCNNSNQSN